MNTVEVTDPEALPFAGDSVTSGRVIRYCRPLATEADLIAAAAHPGEVEIRFMIDEFPDDPYETYHAKDSCVVCFDPEAEYVSPEKRGYDGELEDFGVEWDPTITF